MGKQERKCKNIDCYNIDEINNEMVDIIGKYQNVFKRKGRNQNRK